MDTQTEAIVVTKLKCLYPDCGNEWIPRSDRKPKVCPRCKRYGWSNPPAPKQKVQKPGGVNVVKHSRRRKQSAIDKFKLKRQTKVKENIK